MDTHTIFSLCSGVGMLDLGVELGLEQFGVRGRVVGYCEREVYAQSVLLARMEDQSLDQAPICDSLEDIDERWRGRIDWLVGGFPCQPWSVAGKRAGKTDQRWIWDDILGVIDRVQPRFCFFENVPGLTLGKVDRRVLGNGSEIALRHDGLDAVLRTLAQRWFNAEWLHLSAADVGASHRRERVFILAYSKEQLRTCRGWSASLIGRDGAAVADSRSAELAGRPEQPDPQRPAIAGSSLPIFAPGPNDPRWAEIIREHPYLAPAVVAGVHKLVARKPLVVDSCRADQLRCTGNQVVAAWSALALAILLAEAGL